MSKSSRTPNLTVEIPIPRNEVYLAHDDRTSTFGAIMAPDVATFFGRVWSTLEEKRIDPRKYYYTWKIVTKTSYIGNMPLTDQSDDLFVVNLYKKD